MEFGVDNRFKRPDFIIKDFMSLTTMILCCYNIMKLSYWSISSVSIGLSMKDHQPIAFFCLKLRNRPTGNYVESELNFRNANKANDSELLKITLCKYGNSDVLHHWFELHLCTNLSIDDWIFYLELMRGNDQSEY